MYETMFIKKYAGKVLTRQSNDKGIFGLLITTNHNKNKVPILSEMIFFPDK